MHVKILQKNEFVFKQVGRANMALSIYVSNHNGETIIYFNFNRYVQLPKSCKGKASDFSARGPGFNYRQWQGFVCLLVGFVVVLLVCPKYITCLALLHFAMLIYLVYLTYSEFCDRGELL